MFTGIVEEVGHLEAMGHSVLRFRANQVLDDVHLGDSIAVNGCCLTVVRWGDNWWEADVSDETVQRTSFAAMKVGDVVNYERAARASDRLGGHLVQGHVDGVGEIAAPAPDLHVRVNPDLCRFMVEKGSVAVDGISLTIVDALVDGFTAAIIPHTAEVTTLGTKQTGALVNIEVDVIAKYVDRMIEPHLPQVRNVVNPGGM